MMKYFKLFDDMVTPGRWELGDVLAQDGSEPDLDRGRRFEGPRPLVAEVFKEGRALDFCLSSFNMPIASVRLANAVSAVAGADVQCIPIMVPGQVGMMMVLNSLRVVRCIDESRSWFDKYTKDDPVRPDKAGKYRSVPKLIVDPKIIPPDAHFFRIKDWEVVLLVSEAVKDAMERVGCVGATFTDVNPPD